MNPIINTKAIEDKLTQKIIDNANRLESMKPTHQPEQEWVRNWYKNRQPQILNNLRESEYDMNQWSKQMNNLMQTTYYPSHYHLPENAYKKLPAHHKNVYWVEGEYLPEIQGVFFNSKRPGRSIKIHEFTHSQKPEIQKNLISRHLKLKEGTFPSEYYDDPDEVNSRVMEFRYNNKLDPRKKYTIEEIKNMKPNGDGIEWQQGRPTDLLDRYDDETLLFLINDLAASKNKQSSVHKAQGGFKFPEPKADFVKRLYDPARKTIQDWENPSQVATHKLSFANVNGKWVVFPDVQSINGILHDFTDPKYKHGKWDALDSAIQRGDTLQFKDSLSADYFTQNYKKYFPNFNY